MKRKSILLSILAVFSLTACSAGNTAVQQTTEASTTVSTQPVQQTTSTDSNILVAVFSCSGHTKAVAQYVADAMDADYYEITAAQQYTADDLNYYHDDSRTTKEQKDDSARPAISGSIENMDQYQIVFVGYPVWWGKAPMIIRTFLESYDFSGKTIVPFCTSGDTDISATTSDLHSLTSSSANWLDGARFAAGTDQKTIVSWINNLSPSIRTK